MRRANGRNRQRCMSCPGQEEKDVTWLLLWLQLLHLFLICTLHSRYTQEPILHSTCIETFLLQHAVLPPWIFFLCLCLTCHVFENDSNTDSSRKSTCHPVQCSCMSSGILLDICTHISSTELCRTVIGFLCVLPWGYKLPKNAIPIRCIFWESSTVYVRVNVIHQLNKWNTTLKKHKHWPCKETDSSIYSYSTSWDESIKIKNAHTILTNLVTMLSQSKLQRKWHSCIDRW